MIEKDLQEFMGEEHRLDPRHKQLLKERVMHDINQLDEPARPLSSTPKRRPMRRLVGGIAAAVILVTGTAAAATSLFSGPDPEQAQQVIAQRPEPVAEVYDGTWRPTLRAEAVACLDTAPDVPADSARMGTTWASEFPLNEQLTAEHLITECAVGNDWARSQGGFDPSAATACVHVREYPHGVIPFAIVALDNLRCEDIGSDVRPINDSDLARLNQMRGVEVAILATPDDCPTGDQVATWAIDQTKAWGESLDVTGDISPDDGLATGCFGSYVDWEQGRVFVEQVTFPADNTTDLDVENSDISVNHESLSDALAPSTTSAPARVTQPED